MSDNNIAEESSAPKHHPSYSDHDAGLILSSSDNILFRVHPLILRLGSEVFKNMLSDAQDTNELIQLEETGDIIKVMLDFVYPNGKDFITTAIAFEFIWSLLIAAEKYGIHKILEIFQNRLSSDPYFKKRPVESYALACRFSWKKEIANTCILCIEYVDTPAYSKVFELLDAVHVLRLHKLISARNKRFSDAWSVHVKPEIARLEQSFWNIHDLNAKSQYQIYQNLLLSFAHQEFSRHPSGKTIDAEFWNRPETNYLLSPLGKALIVMYMRGLLSSLPTTVD